MSGNSIKKSILWKTQAKRCYREDTHHHKTPQIINSGEATEKSELSCTVGGNANWNSHYGGQYQNFFKNEE